MNQYHKSTQCSPVTTWIQFYDQALGYPHYKDSKHSAQKEKLCITVPIKRYRNTMISEWANVHIYFVLKGQKIKGA